jgi:hypothetical protein
MDKKRTISDLNAALEEYLCDGRLGVLVLSQLQESV